MNTRVKNVGRVSVLAGHKGFPMKRIFSFLAISLVTLATVVSFGCGGGGKSKESAPELFRVVNAAYDADTIEYGLGEDTARTIVPYGESTQYGDINEGTVSIRVRKENEVLPSLSADLAITPGGTFTYLVTQTSDGLLEGTLLSDTVEVPKGGLFKMRFINAGSNDPVDFYLTLPNEDPDGAATASNIAFKAASSYVSVDPNTLHIHVTATGDTHDLHESHSLTFEADKIYTVIFVEDPGGGRPFHLIILQDN